MYSNTPLPHPVTSVHPYHTQLQCTLYHTQLQVYTLTTPSYKCSLYHTQLQVYTLTAPNNKCTPLPHPVTVTVYSVHPYHPNLQLYTLTTPGYIVYYTIPNKHCILYTIPHPVTVCTIPHLVYSVRFTTPCIQCTLYHT